jgi:hypothetical protein
MSDLKVSKRGSLNPNTNINPAVVLAYAGWLIHQCIDEIIELKMASVVKPLGKRKADRLEMLTNAVEKRRAYIDGYLGHVRKMQGA